MPKEPNQASESLALYQIVDGLIQGMVDSPFQTSQRRRAICSMRMTMIWLEQDMKAIADAMRGEKAITQAPTIIVSDVQKSEIERLKNIINEAHRAIDDFGILGKHRHTHRGLVYRVRKLIQIIK